MVAVITGFEPFGKADFNTSELVIRAIAAQSDQPDVVTTVLPTSYRRAASQITDILREYRPHAVLLLGQSSAARSIRLERVAVNLDNSDLADNDGEVRRRRPVVPEAPGSYHSSLPLERMVAAAGGFDEAIDLSDNAGDYVCNHVYFVATHLAATTLPFSRCGFAHLPVVDASSSRLAQLVGIVRTWIGEL